jgi:lactate permease
MLGFKWPGQRASAVAWLCSLVVACLFFGGDPVGMALANSKGLSLALFIVLIIWSSVFLYNIVAAAGGMNSISRKFATLTNSHLFQGLILAWAFSGFLQGIAGFGVPVAVVAPLVAAQGINPILAVLATLIGHSWSVTFGSMGSSFLTNQLVTQLPADLLAHWTAIVLGMPIILTGLSVSYVLEGVKGLRNAAFPVILIGLAMALVQWCAAINGLPHVAALLAGIAGLGLLALYLWLKSQGMKSSLDAKESGAGMAFWTAISPYSFLIFALGILQIPAVKAGLKGLKYGLNYPAYTTLNGHIIPAETMYSAISLGSHPAPILLAASLFGAAVFVKARYFRWSELRNCFTETAKQCTPTTVTTALLLMMALIMNDTGMTATLASSIAAITGKAFPVFSVLIGALGCFLTGSNTSSNVLFGGLQIQAAKAVGASQAVIAAAQTTGGSLGSAIAPAKVLLGTATLSLNNQESSIFRISLTHTAIILLITGLVVYFLAFS